MATTKEGVPSAFLLSRLHSLMGLWLVVYLILHLFTNAQAALFLGDDGSGFIHAVNSIHELPFLPLIEIAVLAIPILIHALWGILYIYRAKYNSFGNTGIDPYLPQYPRNRTYTWQRITSWILLVGIAAHVIHMRFIEYPVSVKIDKGHAYMVRVSLDDGLYTLAERLGVQLYDHNQIQLLKKEETGELAASATEKMWSFFSSLPDMFHSSPSPQQPLKKSQRLLEEQRQMQHKEWLDALEKRPLTGGQVIAVADNFGTVELLMLRDTFKMPIMLVLYTLLVLFTCFHAFNGLWTAMISWGVTLTQKSQRAMSMIAIFLMVAVTCLGLSAIWLTYWNLKQ